MKHTVSLFRGISLIIFICMSTIHTADAHVHRVRTISKFENLITQSPMSVVIFYDRSEAPATLERDVESISREVRYKNAGLTFIMVDANRLTVLDLFDRYGIDLNNLPQAHLFLCDRPMRTGFISGCFDCDALRALIERFLGRALTTEHNRRVVRQKLAQAPRAYYAADYYNPFYMMPYTNYSPPSDWTEKGPMWIGIDVD